MPDRAMAASSAAIFLASAWWLAATRTARPSEPSAVNHRPRSIAHALVTLVPAVPVGGVRAPAGSGADTQGRGRAWAGGTLQRTDELRRDDGGKARRELEPHLIGPGTVGPDLAHGIAVEVVVP